MDNTAAGRTLRSTDNALIRLRNDIAEIFYLRVCEVAEQKMRLTGKLEGAHDAALKQVLQEWGIRAN